MRAIGNLPELYLLETWQGWEDIKKILLILGDVKKNEPSYAEKPMRVIATEIAQYEI